MSAAKPDPVVLPVETTLYPRIPLMNDEFDRRVVENRKVMAKRLAYEHAAITGGLAALSPLNQRERIRVLIALMVAFDIRAKSRWFKRGETLE